MLTLRGGGLVGVAGGGGRGVGVCEWAIDGGWPADDGVRLRVIIGSFVGALTKILIRKPPSKHSGRLLLPTSQKSRIAETRSLTCDRLPCRPYASNGAVLRSQESGVFCYPQESAKKSGLERSTVNDPSIDLKTRFPRLFRGTCPLREVYIHRIPIWGYRVRRRVAIG